MFSASTKAASGNVPAIPDPQFNYVTMLLHGDGTNGAQNNTFLDSSTNNFTITRNGNTTQGSFSPYGSNWSNYFNGGGDYLTSTWSVIGANQFTCEVWVYIPDNSGRYYIVAPGTDSASHYDGFGLEIFNGYLSMWASSNGSSWNLVTSDTSQGKSANLITPNVWTHVVMTRDSSGVFRSFINGNLQCVVSAGTAALADSTTTVLNVGRTRYGGDFANFSGYMSNLRIVNGSIVTAYSTSSTTVGTQIFTSPTAPLTAVSGTSLLTCQSNRFIDNSINNYTITPSGNTSVQRFNPFGTSTAYSTSVIGGSGYFDGSGDDLTLTMTGGVGSGDFTIEYWLYPTSLYNYITVFSTTRGSTGLSVGTQSAGQLVLYSSGGETLRGTTAMKVNAWNHCAFTRSGTTMRGYLNGVLDATGTSSVNFSATASAIGSLDHSGEYTTGYVSDLRVLSGTALYTGSTLTVPTAPLTAVSNTRLLTSMTNGAIFDNAMMNDLETVGNAQISTSVKKYGTGSISFNGSTDYLKAPQSFQFVYGTGNFTIEFWAYPTSFSGYKTFYSGYLSASSAAGFELGINSSGYLYIYSGGGFAISASSTALTLNTWNHVAMVRNSSTITVYINGTSCGTWSLSSQNFTDNYCVIGKTNTGSSQYFAGYIDDLRITKGYARYTANFTPPTAAFSNTGPY